jgi:hypothetical protein
MVIQKKSLDDYIPLQPMAIFFQKIYMRKEFSKELSSLDYEQAWVACHNKCI